MRGAPVAISAAPIDALHCGREHVIGVYLVETRDGPALVDCGPASTVSALKRGLEARGLKLSDVRHLLLTHIHFDHAGAAGVLVREHPGLRVHVSELGALHLAFPEVLEFGAREIYGARFDELWGPVVGVPEENIEIVGGRVVGLECFPTPGHASHHVSYLDAEGTLYAGDAAGMRIQPERFVLPPTPPPDVDVDAWHRSISEMESRRPARLALTHFGVAADTLDHLAELRERLARWEAAVRSGIAEHQFVEAVRAEVARLGAAPPYMDILPLAQSHGGLKRYCERTPARAAPVADAAPPIEASG